MMNLLSVKHLVWCSFLYFSLVKKNVFRSTKSRLSSMYCSFLWIITLKPWALIVVNTLSSVSVPQAPLGWRAPLHFPVIALTPELFANQRNTECSLRWHDRLIVFNELFWHDVVPPILFAERGFLTWPICNHQLCVHVFPASLALCVCVSVSAQGAGAHV